MKTPQGMLFFPCQRGGGRAIWSAKQLTNTNNFSAFHRKITFKCFKKHLASPSFSALYVSISASDSYRPAGEKKILIAGGT
jgi:hypothetical protein